MSKSILKNKAINLTKQILIAKRSGNVIKEQIAYENLESFAELSKIKNDMKMVENDCD